MDNKKLPDAPLEEVIFELTWDLQPDNSGKHLIDNEYSFSLGKFHQKIVSEFPFHQEKLPADIPSQFLSYQTAHQFWKAKDEWPVVQIGPGILTINDTEKNYSWREEFHPLIVKVVNHLINSYSRIQFKSASLRYIDVVKIEDYLYKDWGSFIKENLNFTFENQFNTRGKIKRFHFDQIFDLNDLGELNVSLSNGFNNKKEPIFNWQTAMSIQGNINPSDLFIWIVEAHDCNSDVFKEICKEDFYGSFS